jgi:hypothetical protein
MKGRDGGFTVGPREWDCKSTATQEGKQKAGLLACLNSEPIRRRNAS